MELVPIFVEKIWSVIYDDGELSEYDRLFDSWLDMNYLVDFFDEHEILLKSPFWQKFNFKKDDAIRLIHKEAKQLLQQFKMLNDNCDKGLTPDFDELFRPLGEGCFEWRLIRSKAYGNEKLSLLRIYAIKIESNVYVITGGAIKLTRTMDECPYLQRELTKMNNVRAWLEDQGIEEKSDIKI